VVNLIGPDKTLIFKCLDEQQDNRSETPSSNNDTELNDADLDENDEVHSPVVLEGNVAVEMTRQLQFVGHQVRILYSTRK
jgi:hypothetical protein